MTKTEHERQTNMELEKLVGTRYESLKDFKTALKNISKTFTASDADEDDLCEFEDYRLDIADKHGFGSIYYLKTRADEMYITEVCYECD
jgi:hypothetical protein